MLPTQQGSFKLFRFAGIDVFLHWSWFFVALIELQSRSRQYSSLLWNTFEYLALFVIVLLHEFGHSLACRQVGGEAERIILWPLGGVAFVSPPQRPGATLWSIAAGPLVNVILAPLLLLLLLLGTRLNWAETLPNIYSLILTVCYIDLALLVFNLLPIYPLDGGQILRSILWFMLGRARSLFVTAIIGLVGVAGIIVFAATVRSIWLGIVAVFILLNCWRGLMEARLLSRVERLPRHSGFACPQCLQPPLAGPFWRCHHCLNPFDTFASQATCPRCGAVFPLTQCLECGRAFPLQQWRQPPA